MLDSIELRKIADNHLKAAELSFDAGLYENAIYVGGYCIECLLKARICDLLELDNLFDPLFEKKEMAKAFKTHDLVALFYLAGFKKKFLVAKSSNLDLSTYWDYLCKNWSEQVRYDIVGSKTKADAADFLNAINNPLNGVKQWILTS